jgi:hypothetical protein
MSKSHIFLVVVAVALSAVGLMSMFWKSKPTDTAIHERAFRLTLPGQWSRQPSSEATRWSYQSDTGRDHLTVSLLSSTKHMSADEQLETLKRVTELRRHAEVVAPGVYGITMTDTTFAESAGVHAARFGGVESGSQRRFFCLLLCSPSTVMVFYYEAIGLTEEESNARARAILNSVGVSG